MSTERHEKPWWFPSLVTDATVARLRKDYPEQCEGMDDESVLEHFEYWRKYEILWDHTGDAYDEYEPLADSFLELLEACQWFLREFQGRDALDPDLEKFARAAITKATER